MSGTRFCPHCSASVREGSQFCQQCGARLSSREPITTEHNNTVSSTKSGKTALVLCIFFGILGVHRFYVGKVGTGLLAFLTGGGLGIWTLIDLILIIQNKFKDSNGNPLMVKGQVSLAAKLGLIIGSIVFWVVFSIGALAIFAAYLTHDLVSTAKGQLEALRENNIQQAYSYTSTEYQKAISLDRFKQWLDQFPELKNNKQVSFDERGINTYTGFLDSGFLEGTVISNEGKKVRIKYLFIKENGYWKILGITLNSEQPNH